MHPATLNAHHVRGLFAPIAVALLFTVLCATGFARNLTAADAPPPKPDPYNLGPKSPYAARFADQRLKTALAHGGSERSEAAVDAALAWLAKHQEADGHWDTVKLKGQESARADTTLTGMAVLAFLAAGNTPHHGPYKRTVQSAIDWIIKQQNTDGCIVPGINGKEVSYGPGYNHAICGMALAEAAGMENMANVRMAAQRAVEYSANKHQDGNATTKLGWRYAAKSAGDTSVSGWFIMQLHAAKTANLSVPPESLRGAIAYLDSVEVVADPKQPFESHRYKYTASTAAPSPTVTLIGCTSRLFLGWNKEELKPAVAWVIENKGLPVWGEGGQTADWYYWYYGTLISYEVGGESWSRWNIAMRDMLIAHQSTDGDDKGSWDATGPYTGEGRMYSTVSATLILEVYYRYAQELAPPTHANAVIVKAVQADDRKKALAFKTKAEADLAAANAGGADAVDLSQSAEYGFRLAANLFADGDDKINAAACIKQAESCSKPDPAPTPAPAPAPTPAPAPAPAPAPQN